jgi:UDPglucose--hexose-1-phosphate uridylyltransferase
MNFPRQPAAHWYLQIIPRLTTQAGFELGSASGINVVDPDEAADHLRKSL